MNLVFGFITLIGLQKEFISISLYLLRFVRLVSEYGVSGLKRSYGDTKG